jgi:hypothetical protein
MLKKKYFMRTNKAILFFISIMLVLSGCSLNEDVAELYTKENPLHAELVLPDTISSEEIVPIQVILTQNGKQVKDVESIQFEIWKYGKSQSTIVQPNQKEDGTYEVHQTFDRDGLYFIKIHASHSGSTIMPQAQFVVGELSDSELEYLQKDLPEQEEMHEHHH